MNAGAFTHRLTFIGAERRQSKSGAVIETQVEVFHARGFLKTNRPSFDKDGLQAREVVDPSTVVFIVRADKRLQTVRWLRWRGALYSIVLQTPATDRTISVTARFVDE